MLNLARHFCRQENYVNFDDDWELIEVLDQEFTGEDVADDDNRWFDPVDAECSPFVSSLKIKYRILSKADLRRLLEGKISKVSTVLSLSRSDSVVLLNHFNWRVSKVHDEWLTREEKVRNDVGLVRSVCEWVYVETSDTNNIDCSFCHESHVPKDMLAASCGHRICRACWIDYITEAIDDGKDCLTLRCPEAACNAAVGIDLIEPALNQDGKQKFDDWLLNSYVNGSVKVKWCPAKDCEYAAVSSYGAYGNTDVTCKCLHSFCWNCSKEAHTPVDCNTVNDWYSENDVQSNNWLLAETMPCPSCGKLIEKNSCQQYACCTLSNYQFLDDAISDHEPEIEGAELSNGEVDAIKELAASSLNRFHQYYEGWSSSEASRGNVLTDLQVLKELQLDYLCSSLGLNTFELDFLVEAHTRAVDCWRLVKWSYVYGYYMPQDEISKNSLFDFLLGQAVKLVKMIEDHVMEFIVGVLDTTISAKEYHMFRGKIIRLTRVNGMYCERLVEALNDHLSEVVTISRSSPRCKADVASCSNPDPTIHPNMD